MPNPAEKLRQSEHHDAFLERTRSSRHVEQARRLLDMETRYIDPIIDRVRGAWVLDLACGSGTQSIAWAERGARVVGIDFDTGLLSIGRKEAEQSAERMEGGPPTWSCGDATKLPFRDGSFDMVFCNSLLEHIPEWQKTLREMSRVLRPGGVVVVYTTNRHCPLQQEVNHFPFYSWLPESVKRRVMAWIMEHRRDMVNYTDFPAVNWFTFPGLSRAFESVGLEPLDRIDIAARKGTASGLKGAFIHAAARWPLLKRGYYVYAISMALYGVRRDDDVPREAVHG